MERKKTRMTIVISEWGTHRHELIAFRTHTNTHTALE